MTAVARALLLVAETATLLAALSFTIPVPPSNEDPIRLLPGAAYAVALFAASRLMRQWNAPAGWVRWPIFVVELAAFALFVTIANEAANLLAGHIRR